MPSQEHNAPWRDEELLRQKYWVEGKSSIEIANEFGCTKACVLKWMKRLGVERRKPTSERPPTIYTRKDGYVECTSTIGGESNSFLLHRLLAVSEYGFESVKDMQVHHESGVPWDNRVSNIQLLDVSEHPSAHATNPEAPWRDKRMLERMCNVYTQNEVADIWDCNQSMVSRWKKRHGLR